jgi:hypothetical protein
VLARYPVRSATCFEHPSWGHERIRIAEHVKRLGPHLARARSSAAAPRRAGGGCRRILVGVDFAIDSHCTQPVGEVEADLIASAVCVAGYFCPSPRKVPNADLRPELLTKQAFWRISARCFDVLTDPTGEMSKVIARRLIEKR